MQLKGYEVQVTCDNRPLPEYNVQLEGDDGKTVACYIPSECGKTFAIEWRDHVKQTHLRFVTKIDGRDAGGNRCPPGGRGYRSGVRTNPTTRQSFQFANLQTTDEDDALGMPSYANLGEIVVCVSRIRAECRSVPHSWGKFKPMGAVHERSKKAGVHCVELGEARRVPTKRIQTMSTPLDPREGDVAKFIFRYRPLALLQAQGIVPHESKPVPSDRTIKRRASEAPVAGPSSQRITSKRSRRYMEADDEQDVKPNIIDADLDDPDSGEDIEVLENKLKKIRRLQDKVERVIKRRKSEGGSQLSATPQPTQVSVKQEEGGASSSRRRHSEPVVIDLTLSDSD
ncbi:hypothetical protein C8Q76DRAFT_416633 [Earliella scabrosa]|nr:hypothetical protein C8Q76DRAFT_416633 [Earliella scabrosa]